MTVMMPHRALDPDADQDIRYRHAVDHFGSDIARFLIGYERDRGRRQELLQEVHVALWQSFATYKGQCSLRTWVYRVAHNVGATHVQRSVGRAAERTEVDLDEAKFVIDGQTDVGATDRRLDLERLLALIHRLAPLDREIMLLYLEDLDAATIGEITGLSAGNVSTKVHRIKALLSAKMRSGSASRG